MSFLESIKNRENIKVYSFEGSIFNFDVSGRPFIELVSGERIYGIANDKSRINQYQRDCIDSISLEEYTIRENFKARFLKEKLTKKYTCKPGDTIVEVGAYLGYHSFRFANLLKGNGSLYAIEMLPEIHEILKLNVEYNFPNLAHAICATIGINENEIVDAFIGGSQADGLRRDVIEKGKRKAQNRKLLTRRLDNLLSELIPNDINLLTMQTNGTELDLLNSVDDDFFQKVKSFAIAANYNTDSPIKFKIANFLINKGYEVEIINYDFGSWVYANKRLNSINNYTQNEPIFIGGCGRSGTTLLRVMLDSHSKIYGGPESNLIENNVYSKIDEKSLKRFSEKFSIDFHEVKEIASEVNLFPEFFKKILSSLASNNNKLRWVDKTPNNIRHIEYIFDNFPNAKFINIIRDGRDVSCSLLTHPKYKIHNGNIISTNKSNNYNECVNRWINDINAGLHWLNDPRVLVVKYENLVLNPQDTIRGILEFLDETFEHSVMKHYKVSGPTRDIKTYPNNRKANDPINDKSIGRWKKELKKDQLAYFKKECGELLIKLGYEKDCSW